MRKEDLIENEIYSHESISGVEYLVQYIHTEGDAIITKGKLNLKFYDKGIKKLCRIEDFITSSRPARPEEIHWFNECVRLDTYVSPEQAKENMKTFKQGVWYRLSNGTDKVEKDTYWLMDVYVCDGNYLRSKKYYYIKDNKITIGGAWGALGDYTVIECSLEELPDKHPDKINNMISYADKPYKFETCEWYDILWKWNDKRYIAKFKCLNKDPIESDCIIIQFSEAYYKDNKNSFGDLSFSDKELGDYKKLSLQEVNQFLNKNFNEESFEEGSYVVLTSSASGNNCWSTELPENYCYKLSRDSYSDHRGFGVALDLTGVKTNGWSGAKDFPTKFKIRKANSEEIAEYKRLGKPFNVNQLLQLKNKEFKDEAVHCKTQEEWNFVIKNIVNPKQLSSSDFTRYKEIAIIFKEGTLSSLDYIEQRNYKIYSFEEWCCTFGHKIPMNFGIVVSNIKPLLKDRLKETSNEVLLSEVIRYSVSSIELKDKTNTKTLSETVNKVKQVQTELVNKTSKFIF